MKNQEAITEYYEYFKKYIDIISKQDGRLLKKIGFAVIIDTLGRARFPEAKKDPPKRIIGLIDECSGWVDKDRVSLVQLKYALQKCGRIDGVLLDYVNVQVGGWCNGSVPRISEVDPMIEEVIVKAKEKEKDTVESVRHANLFYQYRNEMVHMFKEPGHPMEVSNDGLSPYYSGMINGAQKKWELVYPLGFFEVLCTSCLNGLKKYLEENDIDPYSCYEFVDMWHR